MSPYLALASLAGIWFLVVTIPGPNFIVVTQHSMSDSRKSGLLIALGCSTGAGVWATSSLLGLIVLFNHATWLYETIRFIGGIYLVAVGLKTVWSAFSSSSPSFDVAFPLKSNFSAFQRGVFASFSNPKTAAFFGSLFLATFPPQAPNWIYFATVGMVFTISFTWYGLVACFFSLPRVQALYRRSKAVLDVMTGSLLSLLGVRLALSI